MSLSACRTDEASYFLQMCHDLILRACWTATPQPHPVVYRTFFFYTRQFSCFVQEKYFVHENDFWRHDQLPRIHKAAWQPRDDPGVLDLFFEPPLPQVDGQSLPRAWRVLFFVISTSTLRKRNFQSSKSVVSTLRKPTFPLFPQVEAQALPILAFASLGLTDSSQVDILGR